MDPVKINLIDSSKDMGNAMIAVETPRHLQEAAAEELSRLLKAGILEPVHHPTKNCSRAFFVQKNNKDGTIKARLVSDLRKVNTNLERGKFRYCTLPQGASVSSDYFNICTDEEIRGKPGTYKNIDDVLVSGNHIVTLEERLERMLKVCLKKNMKLHPDKLQIGRRVTFGGVTIEASKTVGDDQRRVYMSPSEEKLQTFLDLQTPQTKVEVQRVCGMAAQMKKFCPGIMLTFPKLQKLSAHNTVFRWDEELNAEFMTLKKTLKESVKLSPLDVKKRIIAYTDAAVTCGMCYLLLQKKEETDDDKNPEKGYLIISCDSTTFRRAQCQYRPFEAELLAIHWMCEKEDYNLRGSRQFIVYSDAKNMGQYIKSDLQSVKKILDASKC